MSTSVKRRRLAGLLLAVLISAAASGCGATVSRDASGVGLHEAQQLSPQQRFDAAAANYERFHELYTEVQRQISAERWRYPGGDLGPGIGASRASELRGRTQQNAYFFSFVRFQPLGVVAFDGLLERTKQQWLDRGWKASIEGFSLADDRVVAYADDGSWFSFGKAPSGESIELIGMSPVYWGELDELRTAVAERVRTPQHREAMRLLPESEDGEIWAQPGVYPPFPEWEWG